MMAGTHRKRVHGQASQIARSIEHRNRMLRLAVAKGELSFGKSQEERLACLCWISDKLCSGQLCIWGPSTRSKYQLLYAWRDSREDEAALDHELSTPVCPTRENCLLHIYKRHR